VGECSKENPYRKGYSASTICHLYGRKVLDVKRVKNEYRRGELHNNGKEVEIEVSLVSTGGDFKKRMLLFPRNRREGSSRRGEGGLRTTRLLRTGRRRGGEKGGALRGESQKGLTEELCSDNLSLETLALLRRLRPLNYRFFFAVGLGKGHRFRRCPAGPRGRDARTSNNRNGRKGPHPENDFLQTRGGRGNDC